MKIHNDTARDAVMSFMETRCAVSSQHKLPTEAEILSTRFAAFIGEGRVKLALDQLLRAGKLTQYGPYLSDHTIDVL